MCDPDIFKMLPRKLEETCSLTYKLKKEILNLLLTIKQSKKDFKHIDIKQYISSCSCPINSQINYNHK